MIKEDITVAFSRRSLPLSAFLDERRGLEQSREGSAPCLRHSRFINR